jgi:hypothetical protein
MVEAASGPEVQRDGLCERGSGRSSDGATWLSEMAPHRTRGRAWAAPRAEETSRRSGWGCSARDSAANRVEVGARRGQGCRGRCRRRGLLPGPGHRRGRRSTDEEAEALGLSVDNDLGVDEAGGVVGVLDARLEVVTQAAQRLSTSMKSAAKRSTSSSWRRAIERMKNSGSRSIRYR